LLVLDEGWEPPPKISLKSEFLGCVDADGLADEVVDFPPKISLRSGDEEDAGLGFPKISLRSGVCGIIFLYLSRSVSESYTLF
jgi:hypothetical protein